MPRFPVPPPNCSSRGTHDFVEYNTTGGKWTTCRRCGLTPEQVNKLEDNRPHSPPPPRSSCPHCGKQL